MTDFARLWRQARSGELAWLGADGTPSAATVLPLVERTATGAAVPCVALTYDRAALATPIAEAVAVAFTVTDSRSLPGGAAGRAAIGRVTVAADLTGERFADDLLEQELRKFPPARAIADTPLLRRENWWYLPRVLVRLDRVDRTVELPPRRDADRDALLVRDDGAGLRLDVASAPDWSGPTVDLGPGPLRGDGAPTLAHGHDHSPDRERWESWSVRGTLRGDRLDVTARDGRPGLAATPLRLLERLRRARALERGCTRGIEAAERLA
ncbi:hypothetical protein [Pseudonocardia sp.]|uniref:hypothetical protein n=1 Tax=Pseudonocardia sp. TaxID=60912 RepID=UPI00261AA7C4|nr:hypothetical protein [Pseudonocardia sp.]